MHYYSFHVSDYIHDTSHLSPMEDLAFRRLLDLYYTSEKPIPNRTHEVARRIRLPKNEHDISTVLEEFFMFDIQGDCWSHKRCDETIEAYKAKAQRNREVGKLGGRPKANPNGNHEETQTVSKRNPNQEPITINHKPIKSATEVAVCLPDWMPMETWDAFLAMRKKIKKPATDYAIKLLVGKLEKFKQSGQDVQKVLEKSITAGWQDIFEIQEKQQYNKFDVSHVTTPPPPNQDAALRKIEADRKNAAPPSIEVLARIAALRKEISHG